MLTKESVAKPQDVVAPEEAIKDPYVLEFLELKDEYSESQLEAALIERLGTFLLELGGDFAFIGRQRRLRIDDQWFRVDLLLFNRRLRCLVVIDLKIGSFTHADAGQMHVYLNYARERWALPGENRSDPVPSKGTALAHYALEGLPNKVLAAEYKTALPDEEVLAAELGKDATTACRHKAQPQAIARHASTPSRRSIASRVAPDWHQLESDHSMSVTAIAKRPVNPVGRVGIEPTTKGL
jgi:hypothetical protein